MPSSRRSMLFSGAAGFALAVGLAAWSPRSSAQDAAPAAPSDCAAEIEALRKLYRAVPMDFRGLSNERLEALATEVQNARSRLAAYLERCGAESACDAPFMMARLNSVMATRIRLQWAQGENLPPDEVNRRMEKFHRDCIALCERSLACAGAAEAHKDLRCRVHDLEGDLHLQLRNFRAALEHYLAVQRECPEFPEVGNTIIGAATAYQELRRTDEGLAYIQKAIKERYKDASLPFYYEVCWKLLVTAGDLDGMEKWCHDVRRAFPIRMLRDGALKIESDAYRRFLGFSGFRLGYTLFAKGDLSGASAAFVKHVEEIDAMEEELQRSQQTLSQELRIYRQRSTDNINALKSHVGDPPRADFDLENLWVSPHRLRLADEKGKAVAVLFRGYGDARSAEFFKNLDRHLGKRPERKAFAALHFLKGSKDVLGQLEKLQEEIVELGIENAAVGIDPDAERKSIFRAFNAMVGSATFMVFDRQGRLMWWQQDPRDMDSAFAIRIWERLSAE